MLKFTCARKLLQLLTVGQGQSLCLENIKPNLGITRVQITFPKVLRWKQALGKEEPSLNNHFGRVLNSREWSLNLGSTGLLNHSCLCPIAVGGRGEVNFTSIVIVVHYTTDPITSSFFLIELD